MSQTKEKPSLESEEVFTTQDLLDPDTVIAAESNDILNGVDEEQDKVDELEAEEQDNSLELAVEDNVDELEEDLEEEPAEDDLMEEESVDAEMSEAAEPKKATKTVNPNRISELPLSKVKHIIKLDPDVHLVNSEAVFLITKATELFIGSLAKESFSFAVQQKKKTMTKSHVDQALQMLPIEL